MTFINQFFFYKIIRYGSQYGYNVSHHEQAQGLVKIRLGHFGDRGKFIILNIRVGWSHSKMTNCTKLGILKPLLTIGFGKLLSSGVGSPDSGQGSFVQAWCT